VVTALLLAWVSGSVATAEEGGGSASKDTRPVLAVLSFRAGAGLTQDELSSLEEVMLSALEQTERFQVVGRTDVQTMLDLQAKKQMASCTDDTGCMAAIAGELGADYVAAGNVGRIGTATVITFKVIYVRTGKVLLHAQHTVQADAELISAAGKIADEVVAAVFAKRGKAGKAEQPEAANKGESESGTGKVETPAAGSASNVEPGATNPASPLVPPAVSPGAAALVPATVAVPAAPGAAIKVVPNPELAQPRPSLTAPVWVNMPPQFLLVRGPASFQASYRPGSGAPPSHWHVQVASDDAFQQPRIDTTVEGKVTDLDAKELPAGRWFVRVSAIDDNRVEGPFLGPGVVQIAQAQLAPGAPGAVRVTLSSPGIKVACGVDDEPLTPRDAPFEIPARSERQLRCAPADAPAHPAELTIQPPKITVSAHLSLSGPESGVFEVTVHDENGHNLPGLQLMARPAAPLKVGAFRESEGHYRADASWPPNTPRIVTEFADSQDLVGVKFSVKLRQVSAEGQ
jgi:TolB-like protein